MKKPKKKHNNGWLVMGKGERVGVISLLSIITVLLAFSVFRPALPVSKQKELAFHNLDSMIAAQERAAELQEARNEAPASVETMEKPTSGATSRTVPNPPPSSIKPSTSNPSSSLPKQTPSHGTKSIPILDLNTADSTALVELPQIGEVMASRIHRYRNRLGGFVSFEQLFEVRGMDSARFNTVRPYLTLDGKVTPLRVNQDEFKTLLRHPYLEYEQVKALVNYRERKGLIRNWEQFQGIVGEVNPLLREYIAYD